METGTIKKKVEGKNFGFITPSEGSTDVFFHGSVLDGVDFDSLKEGDEVQFEQEASDKGPKATKVVVAAKE